MEEFIEGLKNPKVSKRTEERLKLFNENIHQIYHSYGQSRPHFIKQSIIEGNNIKFIEQETELHQIAKKGVIAGRIYKVINSSESFFDDENLSFQGSCFLVTANIAVCCSHQIMKDRDYIVRIDNRFIKFKQLCQIKVKKTLQNLAEKIRPGQAKSEDYAFLVLETDVTDKKHLEDYLMKTKMTNLEGIENSMFNFDAKIYGYFEELPKQFHSEGVEMKKWLKWTPKDLIKSSGTAEYSNNELSYTVSTEFGFSGAPIVLVHKENSYIVGFHTRGSHFHSKNYGILLNQTFFHYLKTILNEVLGEKEDYNSLQNILNIFQLDSIVEYKKTLKNRLETQPKPNIAFIGKAINKIISKIAQLEDSQLVVQQLSLQDIIISKENKDDFELDLSNIRLSQFVQKGSLDKSNLNCISSVLAEIEKMMKKTANDMPTKKIPKPEEETFGQQDQQSQYLIHVIKYCLYDSIQSLQPPWNFYSKRVKLLSEKIDFIMTEYSTISQYLASRQFQMKQIKFDKRKDDKLEEIISLNYYRLNQHMFRKKFMNLMKYSQERLSESVIARAYLVKLCSFYNQFQNVIKFCQEFTKKQDQSNVNRRYITTIMNKAHPFQRLLDSISPQQLQISLPKLNFMVKNFIFRNKDNKNYQENEIREVYEKILKSQQITFSKEEIDSLVSFQYIFFKGYFQHFEPLLYQLDTKIKASEIKQTVSSLSLRFWQEKKQSLLKQPPHSLKRQFGQKPFNIYEAKIFKEIFIDYEHTVFNKSIYKIIDMTQAEEQQYEEILNILVQIRDNNGLSKGTGFFLNDDTVCTTRHIFEGRQLSCFLIVNERLRLQGKIISAETSLDINNPLCSDIIFLKVKFWYKVMPKENHQPKSHFSNNIYMLDNDIAFNSKQFEGKNYFGMLIGFRKAEGSDQIRPTKSYGQIQMNSKFHPLVGEQHLSGSPILLRLAKQQKGIENIEYQYAIVGIYSGVESEHNGFSGMQIFQAKCFNVQKTFLNTIEFRRLSQSINKILDQYKQFIVKIYSSLDHFLLRVMGQIMRLNSLNIYLKDLTIHNIEFAANIPTDIAFLNPPFYVHSQGIQYYQMPKASFLEIKVQLERQNKQIFVNFTKSLLNKASFFDKSDSLVLQSVLMNQMQLLEKSSSLVQYYTAHLQSKYFFNKQSCKLQPHKNLNQQIISKKLILLPQETKFQKIFKSGPVEHFGRIKLGYSLLKNTSSRIESLMSDNRWALLEIEYFKDFDKVSDCASQNISQDDFYLLAKKIIQGGILETLPYLENNISHQQQQMLEFKEKFITYIKNLTSSSNLSISVRDRFSQQHENKVDRYYKSSKSWSIISEILNLYGSFQV